MTNLQSTIFRSMVLLRGYYATEITKQTRANKEANKKFEIIFQQIGGERRRILWGLLFFFQARGLTILTDI